MCSACAIGESMGINNGDFNLKKIWPILNRAKLASLKWLFLWIAWISWANFWPLSLILVHLHCPLIILSEVGLWVTPTERIHRKQNAVNKLRTRKSNFLSITDDDVTLCSCSSSRVMYNEMGSKAANSGLNVYWELSDEALFGYCGTHFTNARCRRLLIALCNITYFCSVNDATIKVSYF